MKAKVKVYPLVHVRCGSGHVGNMAVDLYHRLRKAGKVRCPYCKTPNVVILSESTYNHLLFYEQLASRYIEPEKYTSRVERLEEEIPMFKEKCIEEE